MTTIQQGVAGECVREPPPTCCYCTIAVVFKGAFARSGGGTGPRLHAYESQINSIHFTKRFARVSRTVAPSPPLPPEQYEVLVYNRISRRLTKLHLSN